MREKLRRAAGAKKEVRKQPRRAKAFRYPAGQSAKSWVRESRLHEITFIDLFAGIGGFRVAFESLGARCVYSSEWNPFAQQTYHANFEEMPDGRDIRSVEPSEIPAHDVLCAGFPCQPFSIAGVSKKNSLGMPHGFDDHHQGNLFFAIERIIRERRPRAFFLENVRNLMTHDRGQTYKVIKTILRDRLGYDVHEKVIDACHVVPQHRERIMIVGFDTSRDFAFPTFGGPRPTLRDVLEDESSVPKKYRLTDHLWTYLRQYAAKHRAAGHGFGYGLVGPENIARTLSARYYKDGSEILVKRGRGRNPRRLTPRECARLMGFPDDFLITVSDTQAYKQFGNSVVVPVVRAVADRILRCLRGERFLSEIQQPTLFSEASREIGAS